MLRDLLTQNYSQNSEFIRYPRGAPELAPEHVDLENIKLKISYRSSSSNFLLNIKDSFLERMQSKL
jgi:hypothetical protein